VDPRAGLGEMEKRKYLTLPGLELQPLNRPARSKKQVKDKKVKLYLCLTKHCAMKAYGGVDV
jgi:hypothetical protein